MPLVNCFDLVASDAKDWLRTLPECSVDLIVTDPPYSSLEKHRKGGRCGRLGKGHRTDRPWFSVVSNEYFEELFALFYSVLQKDRHCYVFCDFETMFVLVDYARNAGFTVHKVLVWDKVHFGMGYHYRARYEFILFMSKGKRPLNDRGVPDVLAFKRLHGAGAAEKPFDLIDTLVRQSVIAGERVIDPFVGSGVVGEAALYRGCSFRGSDIDGDSVRRARVRLREFCKKCKV